MQEGFILSYRKVLADLSALLEGGKVMGLENIEEKKKIVMEVISGELYVPMKVKELAILLNVPKDRRRIALCG